MSEQDGAQRVYTPAEVARILKMSRSTVSKHAARLHGFRVGGALRFPRDYIDMLVREGVEAPPPAEPPRQPLRRVAGEPRGLTPSPRARIPRID